MTQSRDFGTPGKRFDNCSAGWVDASLPTSVASAAGRCADLLNRSCFPVVAQPLRDLNHLDVDIAHPSSTKIKKFRLGTQGFADTPITMLRSDVQSLEFCESANKEFRVNVKLPSIKADSKGGHESRTGGAGARVGLAGWIARST
jgi:hypothetical protein